MIVFQEITFFGSCITYIYFQIKMDTLFVESSEQIDVVEGSLEVKEEPEEDPLAAGKKKPSATLRLSISNPDPGESRLSNIWI